MLSSIAVLAVLSAAITGVDAKFSKASELDNYSFEQFLHESGKTYSGAEYEHRADIFSANFKNIVAHNSNPRATYKMGVNMYTDHSKYVIS